tara:strand:- start:360 stop:1760 length:1401 start_codon:yes stop_codon:yes gene_type:complete
MNNELFEINYTKNIEDKYGNKRDLNYDSLIEKDINEQHSYTIKNRTNLEKIECYTIDPIGCQDADDAFSVYEELNKLFLAIHIADPTEYIPLESTLWKDILKKTTTKYPSNREPIHMMPKKIVEISSLQENDYGCSKNAITILTEINKETFNPINNIRILFTKIHVKKENTYNYKTASENIENIFAFKNGIKIFEQLVNKRATLTKGIKLNDLSTSYPVYEEDNVFLYKDSENEKKIKQMIAEFAIFANSFIGSYLKMNLNEAIFRTCSTNNWINTLYNNISGEELLKEIIQNGIRADYIANVSPHDLVGMPEYCHFTSPIRRLSDCVCHYLLKYVKLKNTNIKKPFTNEELDSISSLCLTSSRTEKKNQYLDIKFRLIQVIHNMLLKQEEVSICYYISNYSGLFLNIIINKINNYNVHLSYSIRVKKYNKNINSKEIHFLNITKVNCFTKYDQGCIPELDEKLLL